MQAMSPHKPAPAHSTLVAEAHIQSFNAAPGEDFEGELVPQTDPIRARTESPLTLRRHCSWGTPGGNRYRGTVEQALTAARLPAGVIQQVADRVERRSTNGRVAISRTGIRSVEDGRDFGRSARAMGFGNTLCFETRVNFRPGHVEYGDLYDVFDESGKQHTVMVPDVCGNVSVLGVRAEMDDGLVVGASASVPEPPGWALMLLGLGLLAWPRARRAARPDPQPGQARLPR